MKLEHRFVDYIPPELEDGVLYVSIEFTTAVHKCPCGCGNKVVTPISPAEWTLLFDGDTISLAPSIGNWGFPCRSHYWIRSDEIKWSYPFSEHQIDEVRAKDEEDARAYFATRADSDGRDNVTTNNPAKNQPGRLLRIRRWLHL